MGRRNGLNRCDLGRIRSFDTRFKNGNDSWSTVIDCRLLNQSDNLLNGSAYGERPTAFSVAVSELLMALEKLKQTELIQIY